jgi:hypothetical protein
MATRAEQFRSEENVRAHGRKQPRKKQRKPKKADWSPESKHAGVKATRALEAAPRGKRPSRESTRSSANRAKPDAAMNLTEEKTRGSPENRAVRSRAKATKVRGR